MQEERGRRGVGQRFPADYIISGDGGEGGDKKKRKQRCQQLKSPNLEFTRGQIRREGKEGKGNREVKASSFSFLFT